MRKIIIILFLLLGIALALNNRGNSIYQIIFSKERSEIPLRIIRLYKSIDDSKGSVGCTSFFVEYSIESQTSHVEEVQIENPIEQNQSVPADSKPQNDSSSPSKPSTNTSKTCKQVYVVDKSEQKEVGHYEQIYHPEVTKTERSYKEYLEYVFYRDDGSSWVKRDYDKSFNADSYLSSHSDEFSRYTFTKKYDEIKTTVVVQEAYYEDVWVVDIPYSAEKGHYKEVCQ